MQVSKHSPEFLAFQQEGDDIVNELIRQDSPLITGLLQMRLKLKTVEDAKAYAQAAKTQLTPED